jgi:hypothetical protein
MAFQRTARSACIGLLLLLSGAYAASMFWLGIQSAYQDRLFQTIVDRTVTAGMSDTVKVKTLLALTHRLLGPPRIGLLMPPEKIRGIKDRYLHSADNALLGGYACAMHVHVLGALLEKAGLEFRQFTMEKDGASHNVGEVKLGGRYVAVDPLYNQMYVNPDGSYASVEQVHAGWAHFKKAAGSGALFKGYRYNPRYDYTPYVSTDWKYRLLNRVLGEERAGRIKTWFIIHRYAYWQAILTIVYACAVVVLAAALWFSRRSEGKRPA